MIIYFPLFLSPSSGPERAAARRRSLRRHLTAAVGVINLRAILSRPASRRLGTGLVVFVIDCGRMSTSGSREDDCAKQQFVISSATDAETASIGSYRVAQKCDPAPVLI